MRVLWVYEVLTPQQKILADIIARRPGWTLDIMTRTQLPPHLSYIPTIYLECRSKVDFRARQKIRQQVKLGKYDIAHGYTSRDFANLLAACRGCRPMPKVIGYRGTINRLDLLDPANWITFWHPRASAITCVCQATQRSLRASSVAESKLATVWEGCDTDSLDTPPRSALLEFGIPEDALVVGTVANIRRVKGVDILLRAAVEIAERRDVYWLIIGALRDPLVEQLASDPRIAPRVKLAGSRANGGRYSGLFDIYVAPSRKEGLSMAIMEAMSQKTCAVVTNVGGNAELIRHEVDGIVIPPEDPQALSQALLRLLDAPDTRARFAASANQRVLTEFSVQAWADRLCDTYQRFVEPIHQQAAA